MKIGFNNSPRKPVKPKYQVGDVVGIFKVLSYEGHNDQHGEHVRAEHVYQVECLNCGNTHIRRQNTFAKQGKGCRHCKDTRPKKQKPTTMWATDQEAQQIARSCKW